MAWRVMASKFWTHENFSYGYMLEQRDASEDYRIVKGTYTRYHGTSAVIGTYPTYGEATRAFDKIIKDAVARERRREARAQV